MPLTVVPDLDDSTCADVLVDVTVDGRLSDGAGHGAANTHLVADEHTADLPVVHTSSSAGALAAGRDDLVSIHDVRLGPIDVAALDVVRVPGEQPGARHVLGMDALRDWCLDVCLASGELRVGHSGAGDQEPEATYPLEMDDRGHSYVTLSWPGVSARACWDTGAGITVVGQSFLDAHGELFTAAGSAYGTDSTGAQVETPILTMRGPEIGGVGFGDHRVAVVDLSAANATLHSPMDVIVGYPTIVQADWWMDFPGRRWGFTRRPGT